MALYGDYIYFDGESVAEIALLQFEQMLQVLERVGLDINQGIIRFGYVKPKDTDYKQGLEWTFEVAEEPKITMDLVIKNKATGQKFILPANQNIPDGYVMTNLPPFNFPVYKEIVGKGTGELSGVMLADIKHAVENGADLSPDITNLLLKEINALKKENQYLKLSDRLSR